MKRCTAPELPHPTGRSSQASRVLPTAASKSTPTSAVLSAPLKPPNTFLTNGENFESSGWLGLKGSGETPEIFLGFGASFLSQSGELGARGYRDYELPMLPALLEGVLLGVSGSSGRSWAAGGSWM